VNRTKDEWLSYLESTHPADIEMGLGRVTQVAQNLDLFKPAPITIVVGGTNGKGTTTAILGQLLAQKGLSTACYNSPHIHQYNERINRRDANGIARLTSDEELCVAFSAIEEGRGDIPLTYFEFGTLAALWQIKQWQVDVALLEVGLGGRLDAVNIVDTDLAIVTSVGLDHQDWLGDTLDLIGYEKAGIGRKNKPLICGQPKVSQGFLDHAKIIDAELISIDQNYSISAIESGWSLVLNPNTDQEKALILPQGHIPYFNIASAIAGLNSIGLLPSAKKINQAIEDTKVAGRLTHIPCAIKESDENSKSIIFILDVAHNPQAAGFLATRLKNCSHGILAVLADKDPEGIVLSLPAIKHWHLAGLSGYRGQSAEQLNTRLMASSQQSIASKHDDVAHAIEYCLDDLEDGEEVLVIGSFLTVAAAEQALKNHPRIEVKHGR
jgi:dihydrofolate synthase/folylpolyglutamate synthase